MQFGQRFCSQNALFRRIYPLCFDIVTDQDPGFIVDKTRGEWLCFAVLNRRCEARHPARARSATLIVSLPAIECLRADTWRSGPLRRKVPLVRSARQARSIASTGLDLLGITEPPRPLDQLRSFDSIVSWYGAGRADFRHGHGSRAALPVSSGVAPGRGGLHATDFYLGQVRISALPQRRRSAHPLRCSAGRIRRDPPVFQQPEETGRCRSSGNWRRTWNRRCPCTGAPVRRIRRWRARCGSTTFTNWGAGWRGPPVRGNDSGITHLAAAVGTRVVAMFGPTDPAVWAPRGPNVEVRTYTWNS